MRIKPWLRPVGLQIEGRGNGIKTNVVNNVEVAKALERPPECEQEQQQLNGGWMRSDLGAHACPHVLRRPTACSGDPFTVVDSGPRGLELRLSAPPLPLPLSNRWLTTPHSPIPSPPPPDLLKFYGCELGAQTNYDKATGTSIVNGAHDLRKLGELLEAFIKKYVQCYSCGNPETTIRVKKEFITLKCKACGAVSPSGRRGQGETAGGTRASHPAHPAIALRPLAPLPGPSCPPHPQPPATQPGE